MDMGQTITGPVRQAKLRTRSALNNFWQCLTETVPAQD